jgi:hypothetical protein
MNRLVPKSPVPPDQWFTLEIHSMGKEITVMVNGKVAQRIQENVVLMPKGRIVLESSDPKTVIDFRKIEIKRLPAGS